MGDPGLIRASIKKIPRRREWLPYPVFLPGELHGRGDWLFEFQFFFFCFREFEIQTFFFMSVVQGSLPSVQNSWVNGLV